MGILHEVGSVAGIRSPHYPVVSPGGAGCHSHTLEGVQANVPFALGAL